MELIQAVPLNTIMLECLRHCLGVQCTWLWPDSSGPKLVPSGPASRWFQPSAVDRLVLTMLFWVVGKMKSLRSMWPVVQQTLQNWSSDPIPALEDLKKEISSQMVIRVLYLLIKLKQSSAITKPQKQFNTWSFYFNAIDIPHISSSNLIQLFITLFAFGMNITQLENLQGLTEIETVYKACL